MKKRINIILVGVLLCLTAVCTGYLCTYSHASQKAEEGLFNTDDVNVMIQEDDTIVFEPTSEYDTGLVFYPGGKVEYTAYAPLMKRLAEQGICCFLAKMPCNLAFLDKGAAKDEMSAWKTVSHWYIGGHSLGGVAASMYASENLGKFDGVVLLAAYSTKDIRNVKVISLYGSKDRVLNIDSYKKNRDNLPEDLTEYVIEGGNHAGFGYYGKQKGDGHATITRKKQQRIAAEQIADFIERTRR